MRQGDEIGWTERGRKSEYFKIVSESLRNRGQPPQWLTRDDAAMTGRVIALPVRQDGDKTFNENVIVEFYSR